MMKNEIDALERKAYYASLLLIYGSLLTKNIYHRMEYCYLSDYSITEISENDKVSRNAVFESLEQGAKKLDDYEKKLKLYSKNKQLVSSLDAIINEKNPDKKDELLRKLKGDIENGI